MAPFIPPPGSKIFFPNAVFKFVRSSLPPHQAVFRVPINFNKFDIRYYLEALYNLKGITDIRTMLYLGHPFRDRLQNNRKLYTSRYKKAIVTMSEDFVWPDPPSAEQTTEIQPKDFAFGKSSSRKYRHLLKNSPYKKSDS